MDVQFACERCGAPLAFAPGTERMRCDHCGHENIIAAKTAAVEELDFRNALKALADNTPIEETRTIKCGTCAAEFSFDANVHADRCPYCGGAIVSDTGQRQRIKPGSVLPFRLTEKEARERLRAWLGSLWFAPSDVNKLARDDGRLTGIYVPYWTFDADTRSSYVGQRGDVYHVPRTVMVRVQGRTVAQRRMEAEIRWTPVSGTVARLFDDVLVLASRSLPESYTARLGPWPLQELVPYQEEYLSGFRSEIYQVGVEDGFSAARQQMEAVIRQDVAVDIGGDRQRIGNIKTQYGAISFKLTLLPIWTAAYRYGTKSYRFVVNGHTGEVQGERPYSWVKIALAVSVALAVAAAAFVVLQRSDALAPAYPIDGSGYPHPGHPR